MGKVGIGVGVRIGVRVGLGWMGGLGKGREGQQQS